MAMKVSISLKKDFGAAYYYELILEDGQVLR